MSAEVADGVSANAVEPPPFASTYCHEGSNVRRSLSPRCHSDCMRMLHVSDGLMRTPKKFEQLDVFAGLSAASRPPGMLATGVALSLSATPGVGASRVQVATLS